jgi:hypothetical protein
VRVFLYIKQKKGKKKMDWYEAVFTWTLYTWSDLRVGSSIMIFLIVCIIRIIEIFEEAMEGRGTGKPYLTSIRFVIVGFFVVCLWPFVVASGVIYLLVHVVSKVIEELNQ